jgi:superfamily II DNA/RNA helicase
VCGKAKTGSGKTLAFGLPLLARCERAQPQRPVALVLVPTRELALQVTEVLEPLAKSVGRRVTPVYGGAPIERQIAALKTGTEVVVATPGRLMGFLPQVEWLLRHIGGPHQTLLFSATLDGAIDHVVRNYLRDPVRHEVASRSVTVEEMVHRFLLVHEMDKVRMLATIVRHHPRTLAFVRSKRGADHLVIALKKEGVAAAAIHGDLHQRHRERALAEFAAGKLEVLVATDVAARGLDIDEIGVVVHYDPPADAKDYLHRSGRTARAGESGVVATLVLWNEELEVRRMQRRLALSVPIVPMFSNDGRLSDLAGWDPQPDEAVGVR